MQIEMKRADEVKVGDMLLKCNVYGFLNLCAVAKVATFAAGRMTEIAYEGGKIRLAQSEERLAVVV